MEDTININKNENEEFSNGLNPEENESKILVKILQII